MVKPINLIDLMAIANKHTKEYITLYEGIDHEYYGTYYWNDGLNSKDVKCISGKWYDYSNNYIRDWNEQDETQALDELPF